ncbi:MAG: portal protein [Candidatus Thorarchaeota archaeon]|jgi:hypothetical protein
MADKTKSRWPRALLQTFGISRPEETEKTYDKISRAADQFGADHERLHARNPYFDWLDRELRLSKDRRVRYQDYSKMDEDAVVSATLDLYSEEATQYSAERSASIWVSGGAEELVDELNGLLALIEVEDVLPGIARGVCKHGDEFQKVSYTHDHGVYRILHVKPGRLNRIEDEIGLLRGFNASERTGPRKPWFRPWDFVHWRLLGGKRNELVYGDSILESARKSWLRLKMVEDALTIYRLMRAPDRNVFYVDVRDSTPEKAFEIVQKWRRRYRKNVIWDPAEGRMTAPHNPIALDEDYFWPVWGGESGSRIDRLQGSANVADIADIEYFRDNFYTGLRIPKGFLGGDQGQGLGLNPHQTLAAQDLRVARKVKRIQRGIIQGFVRLCKIHHALIRDEIIRYPHDFRIELTRVSVQDEMRRLELAQSRIDTATRLRDLADRMDLNAEALGDFILGTVLGLSLEEVKYLRQGGESTSVDKAMAQVPPEMGGIPKSKVGADTTKPVPLPQGQQPPEPGTQAPFPQSAQENLTEGGVGEYIRSKLNQNPDLMRWVYDLAAEVESGPAFRDLCPVPGSLTREDFLQG